MDIVLVMMFLLIFAIFHFFGFVYCYKQFTNDPIPSTDPAYRKMAFVVALFWELFLAKVAIDDLLRI